MLANVRQYTYFGEVITAATGYHLVTALAEAMQAPDLQEGSTE